MTERRKAAKSTVQIENERVIVTEWRFDPGAETTRHLHENDIVVIPLTTGKLLIETDTGETVSGLICGKSYAREKGVEHNVINHNDYEFVFVEIELK